MKKAKHQTNLEHLTKEIYNFVNEVSLAIMSDFFFLKETLYKLSLFIPTIKKLLNM